MKFPHQKELKALPNSELLKLCANTQPTELKIRAQKVLVNRDIDDPEMFGRAHQFSSCQLVEENMGLLPTIGICDFGHIREKHIGFRLTCLPDHRSSHIYFDKDYRHVILADFPNHRKD